MIETKRVSRCGRAYHLSLPKRWCARVGLTAHSLIVIRGEIEGRVYTWKREAVHCSGGLHVSVPPEWRRWWGLTYGSPVVLPLGEGPEIRLDTVPGTSEKWLEERGMVEVVERLRQMEQRQHETYWSGFAEGYNRGYCVGLGQHLRICKGRSEPPR